MGRNQCADTHGVLAEYFIFGSNDLHHRLPTVYTDMIQSGRLGGTWRNTMCTMLLKPADCSAPNNWRHIALLTAAYKFFAKLLYKRLKPALETEHSKTQAVFDRRLG